MARSYAWLKVENRYNLPNLHLGMVGLAKPCEEQIVNGLSAIWDCLNKLNLNYCLTALIILLETSTGAQL